MSTSERCVEVDVVEWARAPVSVCCQAANHLVRHLLRVEDRHDPIERRAEMIPRGHHPRIVFAPGGAGQRCSRAPRRVAYNRGDSERTEPSATPVSQRSKSCPLRVTCAGDGLGNCWDGWTGGCAKRHRASPSRARGSQRTSACSTTDTSGLSSPSVSAERDVPRPRRI